LNRTNLFEYDSLGRRIKHTMPGGQWEGFAYDAVGYVIRHTNFNGTIITNVCDSLNRITNVSSVGYSVQLAYSATGQRTNMVDQSGTTTYEYDQRDRLTLKNVIFTGGPTISLHYAYDKNGNVTNIWSSTTNGMNLRY